MIFFFRYFFWCLCVRVRSRCASALVVKQRTAYKKTWITESGEKGDYFESWVEKESLVFFLWVFFFFSFLLLQQHPVFFLTPSPFLLLRKTPAHDSIERVRKIPLGMKKWKTILKKPCQTLLISFSLFSVFRDITLANAATTRDLSGMCTINTP